MASQNADPSTLVFHDPGWIAAFGGFLHSNNVLFYFSKSPFFDPLSANNTVFTQAAGNPQREQMHLSLRSKFEAELQNHLGVSYVVDSDPLESQAKVRNPSGAEEQAETWIIRKQDRRGLGPQGEVVPLDYFYIVNQIIYQAPRVDSVLNYRLTNVTMALDKMINNVAALPKFSPSSGYPYYDENAKAASAAVVEGQQSKAGTPLPGVAADANPETSLSKGSTQPQSDDRTLVDALRMTMRYGTQYYDDAPLVGEPGNFRYTKTKDPAQNLKAAGTGQALTAIPSSKAGSPAPSQAVKQSPGSMPANDTASKDDAPLAKPKPKRKKSLAANDAA